MASADADPARWPGYTHTGEPSAVAAGPTESGGNSSSTCHLSGKRPFPAEAERQRTNSQFPQRDRPSGLSLQERFLIDSKEMFPDITSLTNQPDTGYSETKRWTAIDGDANIF